MTVTGSKVLPALLLSASVALVSADASAGGFPSNVLVNNPLADGLSTQDTQTMTTIVRLDASTLFAAFVDSGSHISGENYSFTGLSRSTDGGATWTDKGALPNSAMGDGPGARLARHAASGAIFLAATSAFGSVPCFRSTDAGLSFGAPVNAAAGSVVADSPAIAIDNTPASPSYGRIYVAYGELSGPSPGLRLDVSTDTGVTWTNTYSTPGALNGASLVVEPDGTLLVFRFMQGSPSKIAVADSTDGGYTFSAPVTVANLVTTGYDGDLGFPFRTNAFPRAVRNGATGHLYVVYNDAVASPADAGDIFFRLSTDGGATWSGATRLNDDATTHAQFHPAIAVTPDGTHLLVAWYDRRNDPADTAVEYWGVRGTISGGTVTFGADFRISSAAFAPLYGVDPAMNAGTFTDYDEMTADNAGFDVLWSDGRNDSLAAVRKNMNVRFSRVTASSLRGDANGDGARNVGDVFYLVNALFAGGMPPASACHGDVDHDGAVDVVDVFALINFLFAGGPAPVPAC